MPRLSEDVKKRILTVLKAELIQDRNARPKHCINACRERAGIAPSWAKIKDYIAEAAAELAQEGREGAKPAPERQRDLKFDVVQVTTSADQQLAQAIRAVHTAMRQTNVMAIHVTRTGDVKLTHAEEYSL